MCTEIPFFCLRVQNVTVSVESVTKAQMGTDSVCVSLHTLGGAVTKVSPNIFF